MDKRVNLLREWGCDTDRAIARMLNDEGFYMECLEAFARDGSIDKLEKALIAGDTELAFEYSHKLKGVLINIGLKPMYNLDVSIVESLRVGDSGNLMNKINELKGMKEHLNNIMNGR